MNYDMMQGINGGGMMFFAWTIYVLVVIFLVLSIMALWKYINRK
jgi:hypothetical protein